VSGVKACIEDGIERTSYWLFRLDIKHASVRDVQYFRSSQSTKLWVAVSKSAVF